MANVIEGEGLEKRDGEPDQQDPEPGAAQGTGLPAVSRRPRMPTRTRFTPSGRIVPGAGGQDGGPAGRAPGQRGHKARPAPG